MLVSTPLCVYVTSMFINFYRNHYDCHGRPQGRNHISAVADPEGGQIRPWPLIEVGNGVWPPLGGRNSNGRIVNLCKCKDFAPPLIDVGYGFGLPLRKTSILKHENSR